MCGRFTQSFTWAELIALYELVTDIEPQLTPSWNLAPTHNAGVIVLNERRPSFQSMRWGLVPFWAKDPSIGSKLINARSETLAEKPAFRHALKSRRCVVPISGFYEWQRLGKGKQPYFVSREDGRPMAVAGLWEQWNRLLTFTIITVPANEALVTFMTACRRCWRRKAHLPGLRQGMSRSFRIHSPVPSRFCLPPPA
jgi:putative SOS response-associated peptidase YedK